MKRLVISLACTMAFLPACTTVEIAQTSEPSPIVNAAVKARTGVKRAAKTLSHVFSKESWCQLEANKPKQSATSILLSGMKKDTSDIDSVSAYINSKSDHSDVARDITKATFHVVKTSDQARNFLTNNPDVQTVKLELKALEQALISARQAETTFSKAMHAKGGDKADLIIYKTSVDDLRAVTDAFGSRARGSAPVAAS